jgi:O-antigen ligase
MLNRIAFILIAASVVFTTLAYGAVHQPVIAIFYAVVGVTAVLWAADGFVSGEMKIGRSDLQWPLYALAAYGFLQAVPLGPATGISGIQSIPRTISLDPNSTAVSAIHIALLAIFFSTALVFVNSVKRLKLLVGVITVFGFAYAFFAILQGVLSPKMIYGIYEVAVGTPYGSFVNRNNFAAVMLMAAGIPLGLVFANAVAKDRRLLYITAITLMCVSLVLSGSRGGLVAFVTQVLLLLLLTGERRLRGRFYLKAALSILLVAAVVGGAIFVGGESSLTRIADSTAEKDVTTNRLHIWAVTTKVIGSNLPFGTGLGAFGAAFTKYDAASGLERVEQAHNDYLQVAADAGVPGLVIGGFFLFFLFKEARASLKVENAFRRGIAVGAFAGIFAVLVQSTFDFVLHITAVSVMFLTLLTLLSAARYQYSDDLHVREPHRERKRK